MRALFPRLRPSLILFVVAVYCGCAATKRMEVLSASSLASSILDLPIAEVHIHGYDMAAALDGVSAAIEKRSLGKIHFGYAVTLRSVTDFRIHNNPIVHIDASHTTLRKLHDALCAQSGWSWMIEPKGFVFIDDKSYASGTVSSHI
jgi:hypothetical protein